MFRTFRTLSDVLERFERLWKFFVLLTIKRLNFVERILITGTLRNAMAEKEMHIVEYPATVACTCGTCVRVRFPCPDFQYDAHQASRAHARRGGPRGRDT